MRRVGWAIVALLLLPAMAAPQAAAPAPQTRGKNAWFGALEPSATADVGRPSKWGG